jgi:hypothetical protein
MEELARRHFPFVALDPVGITWAIRASADGTKESPYPVVVAGGEHADIEIGRDSGVPLARAIVEQNISVIVDLSQLSKGAWRIFVRDFCRELYRLSRTPRMVIIEEATEFVPQQRRPEMQECYEAVERMVRLGRNFGLGVTLISQRSAQVAKDVLYAMDILIALRTVGKLDIKAMVDLFEENIEESHQGDLAVFKREIASLESGEAFVWWPHGANVFQKVKIRARHTYHAGATPKFEEAALRSAIVEARPDVSKLRELLNVQPEAEDAPVKTGGKNAQNIPPAPCDHEDELRRLRHDNESLALTEGQLREDRNNFLREKDALALQVTALEEENQVAQQLQVAFAAFFGPKLGSFAAAVAATEGAAPPIDIDALARQVAARLPSMNGHGPGITIGAPDALRKKYLETAMTRLYARISELGSDERMVFEYVVGQGKYVGLNTIAKGLTGNDAGATRDRFAKALKALLDAGVVKKGGSGVSQYVPDVAGCARRELSVHSPTDDELAAVEQQVLYRLAKQEVSA